MLKKYQLKRHNHSQLSLVPKKRNHSQLSLVPKKHNHSRLLRVHKTHKRKLLLQMLRQHNLNQPLQVLKLLQYKECQIRQHNHKLVLPMLKLVNKQLLLTGQPLQPGQKRSIYQRSSCSCSSPTISICDNFQKLLDMVA